MHVLQSRRHLFGHTAESRPARGARTTWRTSCVTRIDPSNVVSMSPLGVTSFTGLAVGWSLLWKWCGQKQRASRQLSHTRCVSAAHACSLARRISLVPCGFQESSRAGAWRISARVQQEVSPLAYDPALAAVLGEARRAKGGEPALRAALREAAQRSGATIVELGPAPAELGDVAFPREQTHPSVAGHRAIADLFATPILNKP